MELSSKEQAGLQLAASAKTMASTEFWQCMVNVLLNQEMNCLALLENYLTTQVHPDREEVMTHCLKWYACRVHRKLLLDNVHEALEFKGNLRAQFQQFIADSQQPLSEEAQAILLEYGDM